MANIVEIQTGGSNATVPPPTSTGPTTTTVVGYAPTPVTTIPRALSQLNQNSIVYYPLEIPKYYLRLQVSNYNRTSLLRLGQLVEVGNIILPLPQQLIDAHNVSYEEKDLGIAVPQAISGLGALTGNRNLIGRPDNLNSATQGITRQGLAGFGIAAGGALSSVLGPLASTILDPARAFAGMTPNRFLTILLQGPKYKTFDFTWRLSPKTEQESEALRIIRRNLNNYMSPGLALNGAIFTFPKIFQISIMPNPKYMYKFKPAVLRSLSINYTPGGQPAFYKARPGTDNINAPEGIDMSLSFIELEFWLEGDFNDSNVATDNTLRPSIETRGGIGSDAVIVPNQPGNIPPPRLSDNLFPNR